MANSLVKSLSEAEQYVNTTNSKLSCKVATTANITLSGTQTIDGISISANERVLVKDQSTGSENGIYVCSSGSWSRSTDMDSNESCIPNSFLFIEQGSTNADRMFQLTTNSDIVLDTTSLTFAEYGGGGGGVTSITSGDGINGTGTTGDITLSLDVDDTTIEINASGEASAKTASVTNGATTLATGDQIYDYVTTNTVLLTTNQTVSGSKTFSDSMIINDNLTINSSTTTINSDDLIIKDPLIKIADGNSTDNVDIGFYGEYNSKYSGLIRNTTDEEWYLFKDSTDNPPDPSNLEPANLNSNLDGGVVIKVTAKVNLVKGNCVYIHSDTDSDTTYVDKADASDTSKMPSFGLALKDINANNSGFVITLGNIINVSTTDVVETGITLSDGDVCYISASESGKITNVSPSGESNRIQNIGKVIRLHNSNVTLRVGGAGRTNATPALNDGNIFMGDSNNNSVSKSFYTALTDENVVFTTSSQSLTNKTLTSAILNTSISGTAILDEDNMSSNSNTQLATQQSIKAYADTKNISLASVSDNYLSISGQEITAGNVPVSLGGTGATTLDNLITLGNHTTGNYVASLTAGTLIDLQNNTGEGATPTINVDLSEASEASIANGDYILFLDGGSTGTAAKESLSDLATLFAGSGLTTTNSVLNVIGGDGITANTNDVAITASQTTITSILNDSLVIGRDTDNQIKFGTDNQIIFEVNGGDNVIFKSSGEIEATSLDISGDADIDGTLEADAITIGGSSLSSVIQGTTVTNATTASVATTVTITDNENTNENNAIIFAAGGDVDGGNLSLESDGTLTYNPSTGKITATGFIGELTGDASGNAATATALETARNIGGVSFNGTTDINLPGVNISGNQNTTGNADTATLATTVTVTDSTANTDFPVVFHNESNALLDDTGAFIYNPSSGELSLTGNLSVGDDIKLTSDASIINFGANEEITLTHVHDTGLTLTNTISNTDNRPVIFQLKSEEDDIVANNIIGSLEFAAGDSDGADAATVAAGIHAKAELTFTSSKNNTSLIFTTGESESADSSATAKMTLNSSGNLSVVGDITGLTSDKRLKKNIEILKDPLEKIKSLSGFTYDWSIDKCKKAGFKPSDERQIGVFAQDVQSVIPEAVKPAPFDNINGKSKSGDNYLTVQYEKIVPLLIESIKEQQSMIEDLQGQINELKSIR